MRTKHELLEGLPEAAQGLVEQWQALRKFAARLAEEITGMKRRGKRGFLHNVVILEHWMREALVKLADHVALPVCRGRKQQGPREPLSETEETAPPDVRRPGFRAILPDAYDLEMGARRRAPPVFDISQFSGERGGHRDARIAYRKRLVAIAGVLRNPEIYARRVRAVLEARKRRPKVTFLPRAEQRSALPELLRVSPHSDLGRYVWYHDSS